MLIKTRSRLDERRSGTKLACRYRGGSLSAGAFIQS